MGVHYNVEMPGVDISNMRANANFYSVQSVWACRKWWKKYFAWLYDTARLNAAICWQSVDTHRTHAQFVDELIDAYCWNRLDEGVSWKERRTGIPEVSMGITRSAQATRALLVDSLVKNKKIQPKVLQTLPLKSIREIAEKSDHEAILYSQSRTFLTKQATQGIGGRKGEDKRYLFVFLFFFFLLFFLFSKGTLVCTCISQNSHSLQAMSTGQGQTGKKVEENR